MFEFLFKRPGDKPDETPAGEQAKPAPATGAAASKTGTREEQAARVAGLRGDEAGAAEFILHCEYSELRLAAAEFIDSRYQLERVHAAMRNTDRRVAKLLQGRLDAMRHHACELERGQACIEQAEALARDEKLTPNQVAELDRRWSVIAAPELAARFEALRTQLASRLEAQVALQRAMIDRLGALRKLGGGATPASELAAQLEHMAHAQERALASPERASLPRSLTNEFANELARLKGDLGSIEQDQAASAARAALLDEWQGAGVATLNAEQMKKTWRHLAPGAEADCAAQQQRFDELLAQLPAPLAAPQPKSKEKRGEAGGQPPDQHFLDKVEAMEAAVQHGSLGAAADLDKTLKETRGVRLPPALQERLSHARAELKRLSDWARWGGNVSREELIKAVEQLSTQQPAMSELAKKVGSMRERWKALDTLSGAAPKSLWERFDSACSAAYAPAAAHFKHLADERHTNAAKAQAVIAEAQAEMAKLQGGDQVDWKHMAQAVQRLRLAWSHLGAIDRKDKKRLDQAFSDVLKVLQAPLESQRKAEVSVREDLIAQVAALNPNERHTLETLKNLQERWQEHARALPLERKSEQALWQRFRAACDAVFAQRKEGAHAADAERRAHQEAKEAVCARLEAAAATIEPAAAGKLLREAGAEWHAIGAVPRANEAKIEKRYRAALAGIEHHLDTARRNAGKAQASALRDKLRLCQDLEALIATEGAPAGTDWAERWAALPALGAEYEKALKARFDAGLAALASGRQAYAATLERNRDQLLHEILRLEIAAGIDSGSEFARERLKLQVETLQSSLKSGHKPASQSAQLLQLCTMPALVDDRSASRIAHLFARITKEGK